MSLAIAAISLPACDSESTPAGPSSSATGSSGGAGGSAPSYGDSECGACVKGVCADPIAGCQSDPECVGYLECLYECPIGADGNVEPQCEAGCPIGTSTASLQAKGALEICRAQGPGAECAPCGVPMTGAKHPLLNQECSPAMDPDPCLACSLSNCCESRIPCNGDPPTNPDCAPFRDCIIACYDQNGMKCEETCAGMFPEAAVEDFAEHRACMLYHCAAEQTMCDASMRDECQECFYVTCGDAYTEFASTVDGFLLEACIGVCPIGDEACDQACYDTYPDALDGYFTLAECLVALCSDKC